MSTFHPLLDRLRSCAPVFSPFPGDSSGGGSRSKTNYWSDGVFESSGASTPADAARHGRSAANHRRFLETLPDAPSGMGVASPADSIDTRKHTLRIIRESVHNTSRGSNFALGSGPTKLGGSVGGLIDRGGYGVVGGDGINRNSPFPTGHYPPAAPMTAVERNPAQDSGGGGGGDNAGGGGGSVRFGGRKIEAKGLRRRAQAIRGALMRRGGSEKSKKGSSSPKDGVTTTVDGKGGVGGGVRDPSGAAEGDKAGETQGGDSGRMQLRKPGERGGRSLAGGVAPTSAKNDHVSADREGKVAVAARRPGPGTGGRPTGLITGAVTPWDSGANAKEKLTSSSSFSGDEDSESEATVHRRDEGSIGPHFVSPLTDTTR